MAYVRQPKPSAAREGTVRASLAGPEGRQTIAHGVSRGSCALGDRQPQRGDRKAPGLPRGEERQDRRRHPDVVSFRQGFFRPCVWIIHESVKAWEREGKRGLERALK